MAYGLIYMAIVSALSCEYYAVIATLEAGIYYGLDYGILGIFPGSLFAFFGITAMKA